jgi:hypothetical protein
MSVNNELSASASRPSSAERSDNEYDVLADGLVVDCMMKATAAPVGTPWLWTLAFGQPRGPPRRTGQQVSARSVKWVLRPDGEGAALLVADKMRREPANALDRASPGGTVAWLHFVNPAQMIAEFF